MRRALNFRLALSISDTFPATDQCCCHFALPFRVLTTVSHLAQKSTKVYKRAPFWATISTFRRTILVFFFVSGHNEGQNKGPASQRQFLSVHI